jgi:alpha-L-rhamnosidase
MMQEMAQSLGNAAAEEKFKTIFTKVKQALTTQFINEKGLFQLGEPTISKSDKTIVYDGDTQTAYANAIYMDLLTPALKKTAGQRLVELIKANGGKLATGFLGVKALLPSLSATGHSDIAYQLLLNTDYPSWGFEVVNGANTIWERWDSYVKDKGFTNNAGMNSFNHYAFGSVNEWLFGYMAGIKVNEASYRTLTIWPEIAPKKINEVKAGYHSINGMIVSSWKKKGNHLTLKVSIPVNVKADIYVPTHNDENITESGLIIQNHPHLKIKGKIAGYVIVSVGAGNYIFSSTI